jgi:uncharacterized membrane protein
MIVIVVLACLAAIGYVVTAPAAGRPYTEFYLLGQQGKAVDYPREMRLGHEGTVIVGIINHEHRDVSYRVDVIVGGKTSQQAGPLVVGDGLKWEGEISFVPQVAGEGQKVEFYLYEDGAPEPRLQSLYLWVNVTN